MSHNGPGIRLMGMTRPDHPTRTLVIGAGYAGLMAANRLAGSGAHVTLVNDRDTFVDRIRLHEVIAGTRPVERTARPLRPLLHPGIEFRCGRATAVGEDGAGAWVRLADGRTLTAAHLLLATGSGAGPGGWSWAVEARDRLAALPAGGTVTVTGAGLTGIEVATEIAAARPGLRVSLAGPAGIGQGFGEAGRRHLHEVVRRLGIRLTGPDPAGDLGVDCTGFVLPTLAADSDLPVTPGGALITDEMLRVKGRHRLWAAGDAATIPTQPHLRMACASAEALAAHAADQILGAVAGRALRPVSIGFAGQCLSLGRRDGLVQFVARDDTPRPRILTGRAAALAKEAVCRFAVAAPVRWSRHYRAPAGPAPAPPTQDRMPVGRRPG